MKNFLTKPNLTCFQSTENNYFKNINLHLRAFSLTLSLLLSASFLFAQPPVCGTTVYDPGGPSSNYSNNENFIVTYCSNPLGIVTLDFTTVSIEANYDYLRVYDGTGINGPLLNGNILAPASFTSTAADGCLTIRFTSDGSVTRTGWVANVTCALLGDCADTCADAATNSCSFWVTPADTPRASYAEIQTNGGESCFFVPKDVSMGDSTVTQCFSYLHNPLGSNYGSNSFYVLSETAVIENGDTNGTNDCTQSIDNVEIFDASCTSLITGGDSLVLTSAIPGNTYTICVTGTAGNGTAEGSCEFQCMAHSITPTLSCINPSMLTTSGVTSNSVTLGWTEVGTATSWNIEYGPSGFTPGSGTSISTSTNPFDITGLSAVATYDFYVQSDCVADGLSNFAGPISETTPCGLVIAPTIEDFETSPGSTPACWENLGSENWEFNTSDGHSGNNGSPGDHTTGSGYFANIEDSSPHNVGTTLRTPLVDISALQNPILSFWILSDNEGNSNIDFELNIWDGNMWISNVFTSNSNTGGWLEVVIPLNAYPGPIRAEFVGNERNGSGYWDDFAIDDIAFKNDEECAATCADAVTLSCNSWVTPNDTPRSSYSEIQLNGGESCFLNVVDVSLGDSSVTKCFNYTHTAINASTFYILSGNGVVENGDTNGTNDCSQSIDLVEIFNQSCTSLMSGGDSLVYSNAIQGTTYTICVTGTAGNGTAEGSCEFQCMAHSITPVSDPCAATCADVATNACDVWVTPNDTPRTSYSQIQANSGESCFPAPIDVSTTAASITQCWEYTHNPTPSDYGSSSFYVLSGTSVVENGDTNGTNDCVQTIDNVEIFDQSCTSLLSGGDSLVYTNAVVGTTYSICVTATASNGTAEGSCEFQCMAHSVTPVENELCGATVYDLGGQFGNYASNRNYYVNYCSDVMGEVVTIDFTSVVINDTDDILQVNNGSFNGSPGSSADRPLHSNIRTPGIFTSTAPDGCLAIRFKSDGFTTAAGWAANVTCGPPVECASACTEIPSITCFSWVTPTDAPATSYNDIELGGGESCFVTPLDVSTTTMTATTCWEYVHTTILSESFSVLSENLVVENGDTNGTNDCGQSITSIEIFDDSCNSLMTGGQGLVYTNAVRGFSYVICATGSADNGTAEGMCEFQCMANSVTPITTPTCGYTFYDTGGPNGNYSNNENSSNDVIFCADYPYGVVTLEFTYVSTQNENGEYLNVRSGIGNNIIVLDSDVDSPASFTSITPDGCIGVLFRSNSQTTAGGWVANVTCSPPVDCASSCAEADLLSCFNWEAPIDSLPTTYAEIQANNGAYCFLSPIDVSLGDSSVTQCFEYIHTEYNASSFTVFSESLVVENGDTNGTNDCMQSITTVEVFDTACVSLMVGGLGLEYPLPIADYTYTICVTATAGNGTAEGMCEFQCIANSITPNSGSFCGYTIYDPAGPNASYGPNESVYNTYCPDVPGEIVSVLFTEFWLGNSGAGCSDWITIYDGDDDSAPEILSPSGSTRWCWSEFQMLGGGDLLGRTIRSTDSTGCLTIWFRSDGGADYYSGYTADILCGPAVDCAANCADAATSSCNVWVTTPDVPRVSYADIRRNFGESCFINPVDVSTTPASVTQCFEYTHDTAGSTFFHVLSETQVEELGDVNGTNDCVQAIDSIEIFDPSCTSLLVGGDSLVLTTAVLGTTYTICVTASASNGTAEGMCEFQCMANSVTPEIDLCGTTVYDSGGPTGNYSSNELITTVYCPDLAGDAISVTFTSFKLETNSTGCYDELFIYNGNSAASPSFLTPSGTTGWCWNRDLTTPSGTGDLLGKTITSTDATGCLTFVFDSDSSSQLDGWEANVTCSVLSDCPATCTEVGPLTCAVWETPADQSRATYADIQMSGGESCLLDPLDVSTASMSVTQCWEYTHTNPLSSVFFVYSETSVVENGDTNGANDCDQSITNIEVFDQTCTSIMSVAGDSLRFTNAGQGTTYTVCVTGTAGNGTAEGMCEFQCMAHSVTPDIDPIIACDSTIYDTGGPNGDYVNAEEYNTVYCPDVPGESVTMEFTDVTTGHPYAILSIYNGDGVNVPVLISNLIGPATVTSTSPDGCLTLYWYSSFTVNEGWEANVTCGVATDCAATCADAATSTCSFWVTPVDDLKDSYVEIESNGGESCFRTPVDVSTTPGSVTQCWEYTHDTPGSSRFMVLSETYVVENGDTNGSNDCIQAIDSIEVFDASCNSLDSGPDGFIFFNASQSTTYTICATGTASNGPAEGMCEFQCMANSVTPLSDICGSTVYDTGGIGGSYSNNENYTEVYCPDYPGEKITLDFATISILSFGDNLAIYSGIGTGGPVFSADLQVPETFTSITLDGCITLAFVSNNSSVSSGWIANITCEPQVDCAVTCGDASTNSCNLWITPSDIPTPNYNDVLTNGGVGCFLTPIDVSTSNQSVTQCWEYTHDAYGSTVFSVFAEPLVVENGDTNGTNDCFQSIDNIEIFDASCTSLQSGTGVDYTSAVTGTTYTVCVTATGGNGTAEGMCELQCVANSVTAIGELPPPITCSDLEIIDAFAPPPPTGYCSGNNEVNVVVFEFCPEPGAIVGIEFLFGSFDPNDSLSFYSGPPAAGLGGTLIQSNTGFLSGLIVTANPGECLTVVSNTDGFGSCQDESFPFVEFELFCQFPALEFTCGVDLDPYIFCYSNNLNDATVAEICPDDPNTIIELLVNSGTVEEEPFEFCYDVLSVFSGISGSGSFGILVNPTGINLPPWGSCGDFAGASYVAANPGDCLSFVFNSDFLGSCVNQSEIPFNVSCSAYTPTCANTPPGQYCFGNNETGIIFQDICPTTPGETVQIEIFSEMDNGDTLFVYSGMNGTGTNGTLVQTISGPFFDGVVSGLVDECVTMSINTDAIGSCQDQFYDEIEYFISCVQPPQLFTCGVDTDPFTFCYSDNLSNSIVAEICPQFPTETLSILIDAGIVEADGTSDCYDELYVISTPHGSDVNLGTQVLATGVTPVNDVCGDFAGGTFTADAPGDCLFFVFFSDDIISCDDPDGEVITPFSISCPVQLNQPPTAICQSLIIPAAANCEDITTVAADFDDGSSDPDIGDILTFSVLPTGPYPVGTTMVVLTVTDQDGLSDTCSTTVTVTDGIAPIAICQDITVFLDTAGNGSISAAEIDNMSSDNCAIDSLAVDNDQFDGTNLGPNTVILTVLDVNGNSSTCSSIVTLLDTIPPIAITEDITVELDSMGMVSITPPDIDDGSTDNVGIDTMFIDFPDFDCDDVGPNTVVLTVVDESGNSSTESAIVIVEDNIAPIAMCQDITVQLDSTGNTSISAADLDNMSTDNCAVDSLAIDTDQFDGTNVGPNTVILTVFDVNGNSSTCSSIVTVQDNAPTAITQDITIGVDSTGNVTITPTDIDDGSTDDVGIDSLYLDIVDFNCDDIGPNTVVLTVVDESGNSSTASAIVTVADSIAPLAMCQDITVHLDTMGSASIMAADIDNMSTDNCEIDSLAINNDQFNGTNLGPNTVILTVFDVNGNSSTCSAIVTVVDTIPPTAITEDITVELDSMGMVSITPPDIDDGSTDNVGIDTMFIDIPDFDCDDVGPNTVILTVVDESGNIGTASSTVTVEDNIDPLAMCQDITAELDITGNVTITPQDIDNMSTDNCAIDSLEIDINQFNVNDLGPNQVILKVTDVNGNSSTCSSTVTVVDGCIPAAVNAILEGPYDISTGLMTDQLRVLGVIPTTEPFTNAGLVHVGTGGGEVVLPNVFDVTGENAIIDWVFLELRDATDSTIVLSTRSSLLQADGDVVDMDGVSPVRFCGLSEGNYFVAIRPRHHLATMTAYAIPLSRAIINVYDFRTGNTYVENQNSTPQKQMSNGNWAMYEGDSTTDFIIDAFDRSQVWNTRNQTGYLNEDSNMDGVSNAQDRSQVWNNRNKRAHIPR